MENDWRLIRVLEKQLSQDIQDDCKYTKSGESGAKQQ